MADYDLAIIGGGLNGVSIARDAAGRGLRVIMLEQGDLGCGASAASPRLIHGDLSVLERRDFRQRFDRCAQCFRGTSAVVRDQHAVYAVFHAEPRVFARVHSLDEKFSLPGFAQAIEEWKILISAALAGLFIPAAAVIIEVLIQLVYARS